MNYTGGWRKIFEAEVKKFMKLTFPCTQLMAMITWAKKKSKQIYLHRTKGTYCSYMGNYKKVKFQHSFRR